MQLETATMGRSAALCGQVLVLVLAPLFVSDTSFADTEVSAWRTEDIIDGRIDVDAQFSLIRMFGNDLYSAADASAMLSAVKAGELEGIYQVERRAPAMRAQSIGKGWWEILPMGFDAMCWTEPSSRKPMIIYRKGIGPVSSRIDPALRNAWASCGITPVIPRPYIPTIARPKPAPQPSGNLPPLPSQSLTILVLGDAGPVPGVEVGISEQGGRAYSASTSSTGLVAFDASPGMASIWAYPPPQSNYQPEFRMLEIQSNTSNTLTIRFARLATPGAAGSTCDVKKWHAVFNPCGKEILYDVIQCTGAPYVAYHACMGNPVCVSVAMAEFVLCGEKFDRKRRIPECVNKANVASGCNYAGWP
jgi:hypothetical protein